MIHPTAISLLYGYLAGFVITICLFAGLLYHRVTHPDAYRRKPTDRRVIGILVTLGTVFWFVAVVVFIVSFVGLAIERWWAKRPPR